MDERSTMTRDDQLQADQEAVIAGLRALGPRRLHLTAGQRDTIVAGIALRSARERRRRRMTAAAMVLVAAATALTAPAAVAGGAAFVACACAALALVCLTAAYPGS